MLPAKRSAGWRVGLLVWISLALRCSGAALSTPWATLELTDKDRAISREPWVTYESSSIVGFHSTDAPVSTEAALNPANYQISPGAGGSLAIAETSYRSRLLFMSLRETVNHPDPIAWGHHVFLRLSGPLSSGTYNVTVAAAAFGQEVTLQLLADEDKTLNENIHVNQVGYPLAGPKRAIVSAWLGASTAVAPYIQTTLRLPAGPTSPFSVVDAGTGAEVFTGMAKMFGDGVVHEYFKQVAYHLDFSSLTTPGRYAIKVPGLGVSHAFMVSDDALRPALGAVARTFYGQRCGVALDKEFLYPWERPEPCHADDAEVLEVNPPPAWFQTKFPLPNQANTTSVPLNAETGSYFFPQPPGGTRLQVVGGHHDAGDYGKYVINSGTFVAWMMASLDVLGVDNDDLPLPEAGDGIPDIIQVVQHELQFLEGMQDSDGGVYCVVKPNSTAGEYYEHHLPCGTPSKDTCNFAPDSPVRGRRIAWPKDTTCTAQFAGAMARVARSPWFKTFRPADADRYLQKAVKAWDFLITKAPSGALCYHFYGCIGGMNSAEASPPPWHNTYNCYDPKDDQSHDERIWASVELYAATGEAKYHDYFVQRHCPRYRRWGWQMLPFSYGLATVTYAQMAVQAQGAGNATGTLQVNADMAAKCIDELAAVGKGYTNQAQASPYFLAITERSSAIYGYGWIFQASIAAQLLFAAQLAAQNATEADLWRDTAAMQLNYIMGVNPQGYSLITGLGARRITNPVDDESVYDEWDAPWPGQLIGLTGGFSWLNQYGAAMGKSFPPGNDYAVFDRITDAFNVNTEYTVPEMALALGVLGVLTGKSTTPLPPKPTLTVQLSATSGPAPLTVNFQLTVSGSSADIATVEIDFGDGGHSYQAAPDHTYLEPGRVFTGFATVVDRRGQAVTQKFTVTTSFNATTALPPPSQLQMVAKVDHAAASASAAPPLLAISAPLVPGTNASLPLSVPAVLAAGMTAANDNLAWQGAKDTWTGAALRSERYEDNATYAIDTASPTAMQAILSASSSGLVLDFWLYVNRFLTYGRDNMPMVALLGRNKALFGLQGSKWSGNQLVAGDLGVVANETHLKPALTLGRWHSVRLAALPASNGTGQCSAYVDGNMVAQRECQLSKLFKFCATTGQMMRLVVGTVDGYVDGIRLYASPEGTTTALCGPRPPPPPPPAPPAPPPPVQVFSPYTVNQATLAFMNADSTCGANGSTINTTLPLQLYSYGQPTGVSLLPFKTSYTAGLSTGANGSSTWGAGITGCSLRIASEAVGGSTPNDGGGNAVVTWRLPRTQLLHAIYTNSVTIEAKVFVETWRKGIGKWNSDVFGIFNNWDTFFKFSSDVWKGPALLLSTPASSTTGAFAGTLANASVVEAVITPGTWHHVALIANATTCVLSVDGAEVVAGKCSTEKLMWQPNIDLSVGGFVGWIDDVAVSCDARPTQVPNTTSYAIPPPPALPPVPSPSPPPPPPPPPPPLPRDNRFTPLVPDTATLAVMNADTACGLSGAAVGSGLPLTFYSNGQPTSTVMTPTNATYTAGLSVSASTAPWAVAPVPGCSLRVASEAVTNGNAGVFWKVHRDRLLPAITANAFTIEAKVFAEVWRKGYGKWNADVLGSQCNWDSAFKITHNIWNGMTIQLSTPNAAATGAFSGTLANDTIVQRAITPGSWHHVALAANSTTCVLSVDGSVVVAGNCEAKKLIWQTYTTIYVGGFVGWVDELAVSAAARTTQVPLMP